MNFGDGFRAQIENLPGGTWITQTFAQITAGISAGYHLERNANDTHKDMTADSLRTRRALGMGYLADVLKPFDATVYGVGPSPVHS